SEPAPAVEATAPMPRPEPPRPTPRRIVRTPPPESPVPAVAPGPVGPPDLPILGGAQLAGALRAGGGPGGAGSGQGGGGPGGRGGDCDMVARLERAEVVEGPNFLAERATFTVRTDAGTAARTVTAERRFFPAGGQTTTEVGLDFRGLDDVYLTVGERGATPDGERAWSV
ncbi:hypothetical protein FK511_27885, partial [Klebsiella pneumoniae]|nr:hypothetical protein [Klebsiella pneumoniae]